MSNGGERSGLYPTNLDPNRGGTPQAAPTIADPSIQEERDRVFGNVEQAMGSFRRGESTQFHAMSHVLDELNKWLGVTDTERGKAFNSYLAEMNSTVEPRSEEQSATRKTSPSLGVSHPPGQSLKRARVEEFLDRVSRGEPEDNDGEPKPLRRRRATLREEEMPWFQQSTGSPGRSSCIETCQTLRQFIRAANNLPEGIPSSQWDRLL